MKTFRTLYKIELKLSLRGMDKMCIRDRDFPPSFFCLNIFHGFLNFTTFIIPLFLSLIHI